MSKNITYRLFIIFLLVIIIPFNINKKNSFVNKSIANDDFMILGIAKIIDGDSIIVSNKEIRLHGIDAPEYKQKCHDKNHILYKCGITALNYLKKVTKNKKLKCYISGKDYYERYLSTCFYKQEKNWHNINAQMISSGWATSYSNKSKYYPLMLKAKLNKIGIWQGKFLNPKQYRKLNQKK
jgi:endonuclease YncB( thermonuclease family)